MDDARQELQSKSVLRENNPKNCSPSLGQLVLTHFVGEPYSSGRAAAKVGALIGGIALFSLIAIPSVVCALTSPLVASMLPVILLEGIAFAVPAAIGGAVAGRLAAVSGNLLLGSAIGAAFGLIGGGIYVLLLVSTVEPPETSLIVMVHAAFIGALAGCGGSAVARSRRRGRAGHFVYSIADVLLLVTLSSFVMAFDAGQIHRREAEARIRSAGGYVSWSTVNNAHGIWKVELQRANDRDLIGLGEALNVYSPLDLDLSQSQVTDAAIDRILDHRNLARVNLKGTRVSDMAIIDLRHRRPNLVVVR